jgi:hypothetical protein
MLGLVPSIHVLNAHPMKEDVDGRDKPDHDGKGDVHVSRHEDKRS